MILKAKYVLGLKKKAAKYTKLSECQYFLLLLHFLELNPSLYMYYSHLVYLIIWKLSPQLFDQSYGQSSNTKYDFFCTFQMQNDWCTAAKDGRERWGGRGQL